MRKLTAVTVAALALLVAGCGDDDDSSTARLEDAACADLRNGMSVMQVASSGVNSGLTRKRVAAVLVTGINDKCPEFSEALDASGVPNWLN